MPFLGAHPSLLRALIERGIAEPTPVQRAILEVGDPAADLMVSAQTGSGKTVAFGLSLGPTLLDDAPELPRRAKGGALTGPLALVVTPTRELALQVARELTWLYAYTGAAITTCVGGMDIKRERQALGRDPHFVVGTPGRLCDHLERGALVLQGLRAVVLDEADEMLDMGFRDELERILDAAPAPPARRTLLFSATIPAGIAKLAKRYQRDALRIATAHEAEPHADIEHRAIAIRPSDRVGATVNVLRYHESRGAIVFCATRDGVQDLARELADRGFSVVALSGELSQRERTAALSQLRDGRARVLVATDVAARGLDLPDLELVVHADLPNNREMLIHRSGRTGRAGKKGTSVMLVPLARRGFVERVLGGAQTRIAWSPAPTAADILARDLARLDTDITAEIAELGERDRDLGRALAARVSAEDLAALVVRSHLSAAPEPAALQPVEVPRDGGPRRPREHAPGAHGRNGARDGGGRDGDGGGGGRDGDYVVFRVNIGRHGNADPKWLVPVLCRRGEIERAQIGKIRILPNETHVEIAKSHATSFAVASARPDPRDRKIRIAPLLR